MIFMYARSETPMTSRVVRPRHKTKAGVSHSGWKSWNTREVLKKAVQSMQPEDHASSVRPMLFF